MEDIPFIRGSAAASASAPVLLPFESVLNTSQPFQAPVDDKSNADPALGPSEADLERLWKQYEEDLQAQRAYDEEGVDVFPDPGFVMKTAQIDEKENNSQKKLFVNMCQSKLLGAPAEIKGEDGEMKLRVPLSAGPLREDVDKEGNPCQVVDIIFSMQAIAQCLKDADFKDTISSFAVDALERKYKFRLSREFKYPKLTFKGEARPAAQRIRKAALRPAEPSLIHDAITAQTGATIGGSAAASKIQVAPAVTALQSSSRAIETPNYRMLCELTSGQQPMEYEEYLRKAQVVETTDSKAHRRVLPQTLIIHVDLPLVSSIKDLDTQISAVDLVLTGANPNIPYLLQLDFPFAVDETAVGAKFSAKHKRLVLSLPVVGPRPANVKVQQPGPVNYKQLLGLKNRLMYQLCS